MAGAMEMIGLKSILDNSAFNKSMAEYMKNVDAITGHTDKATGTLGAQFNALGGVVNSFVLGVGAAAVAVGGAFAAMAISALPIEGIAASFEGITGAADEMLAALREGSAGMVSDVELMKNYNLATQLVSKDFADTLPTAMQYLMKVSAATGESMDYMMNSLVRGIGRTSPMILDNLGIQVDLTEAYDLYAASIGKGTDELTKSEQQTALMNQVMEKLAANTADMPDVVDTARQKWESLKTTFVNTKNTLGLALIPAFEPLIDFAGGLIDKYLPGLISGFQGFAAKAAEAMETVVAVLGDLFSGDIGLAIDDFFEGFGDGLRALGIDVPVAKAFIGDLKDTIAGIIGFVQEHSETFKAAITGIAAVLAAAAISNTVTKIARALAGLTTPLGLITAAVGLLFAAWQGNWFGIRDTVTEVMEVLTPYIRDAIAAISAWWAANGESIIASVTAAWFWLRDTITNVLAAVAPFIQTTIENITAWWAANGENIIASVTAAWNWIQTAIQTVLDIVVPLVSGAIDAITGFWSKNGEDIQGSVDGAWQWIQDKIQAVIAFIEPIVAWVTGQINELWNENGANIKSIVSDAWTIISTTIGAAALWIYEKVSGWLEAVQKFWAEHGDTIMAVAGLIWENIKLIFSTAIEIIQSVFAIFVAAFKGDWKTVGAEVMDIVTGIWEMLSGLFENGVKIVTEIVTGLWDSIKSFFTETDWASLGTSIIDGVKNGITNAAGQLWEALKGIAAGALQAAKDALGIKSPSKAAAKEIGVPFTEGIAGGIMAGMSQLRKVDWGAMISPQVQVGAAMAGAGSGTSIVNNRTYNLNMYTNAGHESVLADFRMMGATV